VGNVLGHLRRLLAGEGGDPTDDVRLLQRFASDRDEAAFTTLVQRYGPLVLRVCRNVLFDSHDVDDAFQATFLVLVKKAGTLAQPWLLGPWLHGVAYRVAVRARAQAARRRQHERQAKVMATQDSFSESDWRELGPVIEEEVHSLPEKYRVPFVLCYLEGKTNEEAARLLGCPKGTILSRLSRGRERLRSRLMRRGITLSAALFAAALSEATAQALVPLALVGATVRAAVEMAGGAAAGAGALAAVKLAQDVSGAMLQRKLRRFALLLAIVLLGAGTAALAHFAVQDASTPEDPALPSENATGRLAAQQPARNDLFGDPLPAGALVRLGTLRFRNGGPITQLAFFADGKRLIYGSGEEHLLRVAEFDSGKELRTINLQPHEAMTCVAVSADGKMLAVGLRSNRGAAALFDLATGKELHRLSDPIREVHALAFHPDGKTLVTVAGPDKAIDFWDPKTGKELPSSMAAAGKAGALAFSADGTLLAFTSFLDGKKAIAIWETSPWRELKRLPLDWPAEPLVGDVVAFSPNGKTLAGGDHDAVYLWDLATGQRSEPLLPRQAGVYVGVSFTPDSKTLAVGMIHPTQAVTLWDVATHKQTHNLSAHGWELRGLAFSPTPNRGQPVLVTAGTESTLRLWDPNLGKEQNIQQAHYAAVNSVALLAGGRAVTVSRPERTYRVWDAATGRELNKGSTGDRDVQTVLVASSANLLAVSHVGKAQGTVDKTIRLIDVVSGKEVRRLENEGEDGMWPVACTPDGRHLAAVVGKRRVLIWDAAAAKVLRRIEVETDVEWSPTAALTADGKLLALRLTAGPTRFGVWDVTTGNRRWVSPFLPGASDTLVFSPDGKLLAQGGPGTIVLWDSATGQRAGELACPDTFPFGCFQGRLAFSSDSKTLVGCNCGPSVFLWDVATGKERRHFDAHRGRVFAVSAAPDGPTFATAGADTTGVIWEMRAP
jgi:RNA polymerase sigma factor (sigma-70 family)